MFKAAVSVIVRTQDLSDNEFQTDRPATVKACQPIYLASTAVRREVDNGRSQMHHWRLAPTEAFLKSLDQKVLQRCCRCCVTKTRLWSQWI